jgi:hypothetical protein
MDVPRIVVQDPIRLTQSGDPVAIDPILVDARNDDHVILSQLVLAFLKLHNRIVTSLKASNNNSAVAYARTRAFMIIAWRNIIAYDYLQRLLDVDIYQMMLADDLPRLWTSAQDEPRLLADKKASCIPLEFSLAASRVGHSMVRNQYHINDQLSSAPRGVQSLRSVLRRSSFSEAKAVPITDDWVVDWRNFFEISSMRPPQSARRLTPFLAPALVESSFFIAEASARESLSLRDMWCCAGLVGSGQDCARKLARLLGKPLDVLEDKRMLPTAFEHTQVNVAGPALTAALSARPKFLRSTPLSYYILQEAAVLGEAGSRLGPLGSYIVAYTLKDALTAPVRIGSLKYQLRPASEVRGVRDMAEFLGLLIVGEEVLMRRVGETLNDHNDE